MLDMCTFQTTPKLSNACKNYSNFLVIYFNLNFLFFNYSIFTKSF